MSLYNARMFFFHENIFTVSANLLSAAVSTVLVFSRTVTVDRFTAQPTNEATLAFR